MQEFILGLSYLYQAPVVATLPQPLTPSIAYAVGNPDFPAYLPNFRIPLTPQMSFLQRLSNTVVGLYEVLNTYINHLPHQDAVMRSLLENTTDVPYIGELYSNLALVLTLTHFAINYPRPVLKNVIEVGGLSSGKKTFLPDDLSTFLNEAMDGVIYFSWGSHYEVAEDAEILEEALMNVFSKLNQRVVFKWNHTDFPNKPKNVLVKTWVPQIALLAHKNLKLFISHSGLNSVYEAIDQGVPIVATPQFGDQPHNSKILEFLGIAVVVEKAQLTDGVTLINAINRVLSDSSFRKNSEKRGQMIRDRLVPAVDEGAYWIEYILKYGAESLQPASLHLPWYRLALIDVYAALLAPILIIVLGFFATVSLIRRKACRKYITSTKKNN